MKVEDLLNETIQKDGAVHLTLIDPDSQAPWVTNQLKTKKPLYKVCYKN